MIEVDIGPGTEPITEGQSGAKMFEFLFPGNKFEGLPKVDLRNGDILWKLVVVENGRRIKLVQAMIEGGEFVEREEFGHPDQVTISYYTNNLAPLAKVTHPIMFQGRNFADVVDVQKGEKIGGVAFRKITWQGLSIPGKREIILGVLDKEGRPRAIIYFGEGKRPKKSKQVEEMIPAPVRVRGDDNRRKIISVVAEDGQKH